MKRIAVYIAAMFLLSGCFVWDELNKSEALLDAYSPKARKQQEEQEAARAAAEAEKQPSASERAAEWWGSAHSIGARPDDAPSADPMVSCRLGAGVRFTKRSECIARGGSLPKG
jgi:hypothetical protein